MINPDYSVKEIETRFFTFLKDRVGDFEITEQLSQMKGGNEAYLYRFQVSGIPDMDKPLVLRLFPIFYGEEKAKWEGIIQNLLNQQGIPAPRVHLTSSDTTILGGSFLVMDYIEGDAVDPGDDPSILILAARTQAVLHQIDGKPITEGFLALGQNGSPSIDGRLGWLLDRAKKHPQLNEIFQWLVTNKPALPAKLVVVHGDFHPMNMLVKEGKVVAILDWSGFIVGDPMVGLGWTLGIFIASAKHTIPKDRFEELLGLYQSEYEKIQVIDHQKLEYFIAFRLAMALLEGLDGQEWWTQPEIVRTIVDELRERTGITIKSARAVGNNIAR